MLPIVVNLLGHGQALQHGPLAGRVEEKEKISCSLQTLWCGLQKKIPLLKGDRVVVLEREMEGAGTGEMTPWLGRVKDESFRCMLELVQTWVRRVSTLV